MKRFQPVVMEILHEGAMLLSQEIKFHRLTMQIAGLDTNAPLSAYDRDYTELLVMAIQQVTAIAQEIAPELLIQTNFPDPALWDNARRAVLRRRPVARLIPQPTDKETRPC